MPGPHGFNMSVFVVELVFTVFAVFFCFIIYLKTKGAYELTKYKGISYFRTAFLFFGLSYLVRFILGFLFLWQVAVEFSRPAPFLPPLLLLPVGYFSTVAILYLIYSAVWKRLDNPAFVIIGHSTAILLSLIAFITESHLMLLYLQSALLVIMLLVSLFLHKEVKKVSQIQALYSLVFFLWLINLWIIDRRRPMGLEIEGIFQVVSLVVFIIIYLKVSKWVR